MADENQPPRSSPSVLDDRASGILLHVTSLPSPYGIGDLGPSAFAWVDRLARAGQSWWQALPLGPTGYGNSPYQPLSSFAGNILLISPDRLVEDGLLQPSDLDPASFPTGEVDYPAVIQFKHRLLARAWSRFRTGACADQHHAFEQYCRDHADWLNDYALFRALKVRHGGAHYLTWSRDIMVREPAALDAARRKHAALIDVARFGQFLVATQGGLLREYARARGVRLIGDLPFFVSPDSSDVWANPEIFQLDEERRPRFVAGVPPDYFSPEGQLWGNPVYDWNALRRTGYRWWLDRLRALLVHVDLVRLDHFRGYAAAWHIPAGAATAQSGRWLPGPGGELFQATQSELGRLPLIAEDLGLITPDVRELREQFQLPGMRVLQFAFDGDPDNPFLPHNYGPDAVVYTGTHDNDTTRGWYESLPEGQRQALWSYLGRSSRESGDIAWELIRLAWSSAASLAMAPLQDVLNLGKEARMNRPGSAAGNWRWRVTDGMLTEPIFDRLRVLTEQSERLPTASYLPERQAPTAKDPACRIGTSPASHPEDKTLGYEDH
jgi:4-alpha-glucanotransferase